MKRLLAPLTLLAPTFFAVAAETDKSAYTFSNPTPREQMRELSTDRPDQTESPYTVDAGHWQIEFDFANYTYDHDAGTRTETFNIAPVNVKLGLTNNSDIQFIFDSYTSERVRTAGVTTTTRDWGDLTIRLKYNIWGNDSGDTAFAAMPFVKVPLQLGDAGNDLVEGGLILPLAVALPAGWGLGLMTEFDWLADSTGNDRHLEWINSITFSHDITSRLGGYVEFFSAHSYESGTEWMAQADIGFTYAVNADTQLDCGCNFGVTRNAPDVQPFIGLTLRY
ncbi:transporter [Rariglobus hedericola]|uniref:Transporter n=1 Tax=Rariglobus hedericola TaxID=2597822 RepID=A0A556QNL4_9BACT|nr:transporter [Rariglobus hedericola]TSJ78217.1 transporter [Rariglobus hedericola]